MECFSGEACLIKLGRTGEYIPVRSGGRQKRECFEYTGEKLCWEGISKLKDGRGITVAKLNTLFFRWTNIGELSIAKMTEDKREVVISTLAAMHWRMQSAAAKATEERRCIEAEDEANRFKEEKQKGLKRTG